ncbi:unnamed protein product [Phytomonas sp. EM1]|nr:unnamed protein product [Phytomonas sp. EM1]|eukprot:CCW61657.1 unnamed protein product [Phytomonas sp. isolate EM1]
MWPFKVYFLCLLFFFALMIRETLCWNCRGHMLVAEIARRHLTEENRRKVEENAQSFSKSGPFPKSIDFVQASCWPDDLKSWHMFAMKSWHYIDLPFSPDNVPVNKCEVMGMNVITASESMMDALRLEKSPAYVHQFALVSLVHFIGDIHQPLHATTRYTKNHPDGDAGGNTFFVYENGKRLNLHSLWDDVCVPNDKIIHRPLSDTDYTTLKAFADYLEDTYKFDSALLKETSIKAFAQESHMFGINTTYEGIEEGAEISDVYLGRCRQVAEARLTLAGRRLANLLNKLLEGVDVGKPDKDKFSKSIKGLEVRERNFIK